MSTFKLGTPVKRVDQTRTSAARATTRERKRARASKYSSVPLDTVRLMGELARESAR